LINSPTEPCKEARLCGLFFDDLRDEVLREHAWGFAVTRARLARPVGDPPGPWPFQYQVPVDCLRPLFLETAAEYRIEGDRLYTGLDQAVLAYVKRETDPTRFDAHFVRALAARLAAELAVPITNQKSLAEAMWQLYERELSRAKAADAATNRETTDPQDPWLTTRK
jgi:hypothetical protein